MRSPERLSRWSSAAFSDIVILRSTPLQSLAIAPAASTDAGFFIRI